MHANIEAVAAPVDPVLRCLAGGEARSGAELARALGVSRAAVWKRVQGLRARGLPIEGQAGIGYRLPWALELLDCDRIGTLLPATLRSRLAGLEVLAEVDSTSSELRRRGARELDIVLAECQSAGRGRRGRAWLSPPGLNIYLSCSKRFDGGLASLSGLSLAVGVMLMQALTASGITGVGLKWPNDLLGARRSAAPDAKLAGVLVELDGEVGGPCNAIIGIGVNLRLPEDVRVRTRQTVTDLAELGGGKVPARNALAAQIISHLVRGLARFEKRGFAAFADAYAEHDLLRGRRVRVQTAQYAFKARADGVDAHGALRVHTADGDLAVDSAEVSVRAA